MTRSPSVALLVVSLALLGCGGGGPPTAPPVAVASGELADSTIDGVVSVRFLLADAAGGATTASGTLLVEITDRPGVSGAETEVCSARVIVAASRFAKLEGSPTTWPANVPAGFSPACPPRPAAMHRQARLTFTPTGGQPLPPLHVEVSPSAAPSLAGEVVAIVAPTAPPPTPVAAPVPPPAADGVRFDPWPVTVAASGATVAQDPDASPGFPDAKVVRTAACTVSVRRFATLTVSGATIRGRLASDGATFSVDDAAAGSSWRLEYALPSGEAGVSYGVVGGEWSYVCRGQYTAAPERACASAICSTLRSTAPPVAPAHVPAPDEELLLGPP